VTETVLAILFLVIATTSAVVQGAALWKVARAHVDNSTIRVHDAMVRTAVCRVLAATAYVVVGVLTLVSQQTFPVLALAVFAAVMLMWQANAVADVRLRRDLARRRVE
jgi:hypothetical protein